jgi:hypothetical protein
MCVYCMIGDHPFKFDPPWPVPATEPYIPQPVVPLTPDYQPWKLDRLREYYDLLQRVKELEDRLGCPCEPNKADYLKQFADRIAALERAARGEKPLTMSESG